MGGEDREDDDSPIFPLVFLVCFFLVLSFSSLLFIKYHHSDRHHNKRPYRDFNREFLINNNNLNLNRNKLAFRGFGGLDGKAKGLGKRNMIKEPSLNKKEESEFLWEKEKKREKQEKFSELQIYLIFPPIRRKLFSLFYFFPPHPLLPIPPHSPLIPLFLSLPLPPPQRRRFPHDLDGSPLLSCWI